MNSTIQNMTAKEFKNTIRDSKTPVLVDFWAPWCGPCRQLSPVLDDVASRYSDKVKFAKVNVDEEPELAHQYGVQSIPNLFIFRDGKPVRQLVGFHDKKTIESALL